MIVQRSELGEGAVIEVVEAAGRRARDGRLDRDDLHRLLDEVRLPATAYAAALEGVQRAGITIVDASDEEDDDDGPAVDGFAAFLERTSHNVLTFEEEQALGRRIDAGRLAQQYLAGDGDVPADLRRSLERAVRDGRAAEDELARNNIRLVLSIAGKLSGQCSAGLEYEDLVQEGWLGLAHAISKWEHSRGLKFSTYATWWIRQRMQRAIDNDSRTIRLPVHFRETLRTVLRAERRLLANAEDASAAAIASVTGIGVKTVESALAWRRDATSLDVQLRDGGATRGDLVADGTDVEVEAERALLAEAVHEALEELSERERSVVEHRFGLADGIPKTLEEIGQMYGVTRERIRQIESKVIAKLRHPQRSKKLRAYLEVD